MEGYAGICTCRHDVGRRCYACVRVYTVNMVPCVCACYVRTIAEVQYARISYTNLRACIYRDLCTSSTVRRSASLDAQPAWETALYCISGTALYCISSNHCNCDCMWGHAGFIMLNDQRPTPTIYHLQGRPSSNFFISSADSLWSGNPPFNGAAELSTSKHKEASKSHPEFLLPLAVRKLQIVDDKSGKCSKIKKG